MTHNKSDQSGFAIVEVLLVLVILGMLGFTGWFVWHSKQTADKTFTESTKTGQTTKTTSPIKTFEDCKKAPGSKILITYPEQCVTEAGKTFSDQSDQTLGWTQYTSPDGAYKMKIPDGWNINQNSETKGALQVRDDSLAIKPGTKGTFFVTPGNGHDGDSGLTIYFYDAEQSSSELKNVTEGAAKQASLRTKSGGEIQKYTYTQEIDSIGPGLKKGGKAFIYAIFSGQKLVECYYSINPDQIDYHTNVESALETVQIL